jgi:hypothetical protein
MHGCVPDKQPEIHCRTVVIQQAEIGGGLLLLSNHNSMTKVVVIKPPPISAHTMTTVLQIAVELIIQAKYTSCPMDQQTGKYPRWGIPMWASCTVLCKLVVHVQS